MASQQLQKLGYAFNNDGILKKIDLENGRLTNDGFEFKDQDQYEELGDSITEYIYELLLKKNMFKIHVPSDIPKEQSTFIFASKPNLSGTKKILVLIHGSGVVRAGQWARSLIINQSLNHGTQIPYIQKAKELNYDILITNTNDNYRIVNGVETSIPGHKTPIEHAITVWQKHVIDANPESVAIVAHSYGGVIAIELARKFPTFFQEKVFGLGFTDSVHSFSRLNEDIGKHLKRIGRNWVGSKKLLNELVDINTNDIARYSAGHPKHEWTSYSCMSAVFDFFEDKYKEFLQSKNQGKKPKLEL